MFSASAIVNDTMVRDFIPVRIGEVGYLLDLVEWKLYTNSGTGAFNVGSDKQTSTLCPDTIYCNRGKLTATDSGIVASGSHEVTIYSDKRLIIKE